MKKLNSKIRSVKLLRLIKLSRGQLGFKFDHLPAKHQPFPYMKLLCLADHSTIYCLKGVVYSFYEIHAFCCVLRYFCKLLPNIFAKCLKERWLGKPWAVWHSKTKYWYQTTPFFSKMIHLLLCDIFKLFLNGILFKHFIALKIRL